jgi:hypothetical protein
VTIMISATVDLLTDQGNGAVLRLPNRKFPGILIQGDTLKNYIFTLREVLEAFQRGDANDAQAVVLELKADLEELRSRYESALEQHGIPLPY